METLLLQQTHNSTRFEGINEIKSLIMELRNEYSLRHEHIDRKTSDIESLLRGHKNLEQQILNLTGEMK